MAAIEKNEFSGWEVSIIKITYNKEIKYKVTRRFPELNVAETKIFTEKNKAVEQFQLWLHNF